jgi:hypothetical protein
VESEGSLLCSLIPSVVPILSQMNTISTTIDNTFVYYTYSSVHVISLSKGSAHHLNSRCAETLIAISFEVFTAMAMEDTIFWDVKSTETSVDLPGLHGFTSQKSTLLITVLCYGKFCLVLSIIRCTLNIRCCRSWISFWPQVICSHYEI